MVLVLVEFVKDEDELCLVVPQHGHEAGSVLTVAGTTFGGPDWYSLYTTDEGHDVGPHLIHGVEFA